VVHAAGQLWLFAAPTRAIDNEAGKAQHLFLNKIRQERLRVEETCPVDWLFIMDSSGSVQRVYKGEKFSLTQCTSKLLIFEI